MPAMVVIPSNGHTRHRVRVDRVHSIISNRIHGDEEQYLVRWSTEDESSTQPPLSWHPIKDLLRCLEHVQDHLEVRGSSTTSDQAQAITRKRKSPDNEHERRFSPFDSQLRRTSQTPSSRSSPVSSPPPSSIDVYNGVLETDEHGYIYCKPDTGPDIQQLDIRTVPEMSQAAHEASVSKALTYIRNEYIRRLSKVSQEYAKPIRLVNLVDSSTPSLRFRYIPDYVLQEGVYRAAPETQQGCTSCSPHMGRDIGCEYTRKCECLEYAAVDEARLNDKEREQYERALETGASTMELPKKFPYWASGTKREREGCLVPFYLNSRRPIYECNDKCHCGPYCRNKNVQFGRQVEVEIFRSSDGRGWGLRCCEDLHGGQFIDTYRGEVITDAEATRRENASSKAKASYLYSLDKFAESEGLDEKDLYVVDGEFMGGPTKFINHSCEPNCRQYTVSYNKHDPRVYDIAFFACRFIPKGEELTFDYLDKDEEDEDEDNEQVPGEDAIPCLCGAKKCRKWLWT